MAGIPFTFASGLHNTVFGKTQYPIKRLIEKGIEAQEVMSALKSIFYFDKINTFGAEYDYETALGDFAVVAEGGAYPITDFQDGYSKVIQPVQWLNSFLVTQIAAEDANMGKIKKGAANFALTYARTREKFGATMLMGGIGTSVAFGGHTHDTTAADGLAMFSTGHTSKTGRTSTQSNLYAGAFSYDNLMKAQEHMQNLTDDDGNLLNICPDTIIIPNDAATYHDVMSAVGTQGGEPGTSTYSVNTQAGLWNVIKWPFLNAVKPSGQLPWFVLDSKYNEANQSFVWQERVPLSVKSDMDDNDNNVFKGRARFGVGFVDWRPVFCSYVSSGGTSF